MLLIFTNQLELDDIAINEQVLMAEIIGTLLVKYIIGTQASLGANAPNYSYTIPLVFGFEVLASALLMAVISSFFTSISKDNL